MTFATPPTPSDLTKELGEWALAAGRFFQSEQTGFVHLYQGNEELRAQTIPLLENALFALALLRSRLVEQVQEAKKLLKALLVFQNLQTGNEYGNFPVYLHEYPACRDPALGLQLLAPFFWILKQFGHILGGELKQQLEKTVSLVIEHSLSIHHLKPFPYALAVRLMAARLAYGVLWANNVWQQAGREELERLSHHQLEGWQTTKHLADILVGLQMVYPALSQSPWSLLWQRMKDTWHTSLACYTGPCVREWQAGEEPQVNLYDLFGGFFSGQFSRRSSLLSPCHMHGILIQSTSDQFYQPEASWMVEGKLNRQVWRTIGNPHWAYTVLEKKEPYQPNADKTHTPFRYIWGDLHRLHSFVCQGGNIEKIDYQAKENALILNFDLRDDSSEKADSSRSEIEFFIDFHPDFKFQLNGHTATTFELGQVIKFSFAQRQLLMVFDLVEGEGCFLGHFMRGNRPSQLDRKGEKRFLAYDWTFFLRTIRRQSPCKIRATLTLPYD